MHGFPQYFENSIFHHLLVSIFAVERFDVQIIMYLFPQSFFLIISEIFLILLIHSFITMWLGWFISTYLDLNLFQTQDFMSSINSGKFCHYLFGCYHPHSLCSLFLEHLLVACCVWFYIYIYIYIYLKYSLVFSIFSSLTILSRLIIQHTHPLFISISPAFFITNGVLMHRITCFHVFKLQWIL